MRKIVMCIAISVLLSSCETYPTPIYTPRSNYPSTAINTEDSYENLIKTYKSEKAEVLNYLLNSESPNDPKTAITVENTSSCNIVITISGNNFLKKIPIASGKMGSAMIPKNQNYRLSGKVCNSSYQTSKYITKITSIKLSQ